MYTDTVNNLDTVSTVKLVQFPFVMLLDLCSVYAAENEVILESSPVFKLFKICFLLGTIATIVYCS